MDAITALSRGGKEGLAASSRSIFEGKLALGPTLPPTADAIGMKVESGSDFDIGYRGIVVQKQHELGSLAKVRRRCTSSRESSSLGEEFIGEGRTVAWQWSGHGTALLSEQSL
jgi:hypothetical protein